MLNPDGSFQPQCKRGLPTPGASLCYMLGLHRRWPHNPVAGQYLLTFLPQDQAARVDAVSGCCLMARREVWTEIGPLDEAIFAFGEDLDWCVRAKKAGWDVWYSPAAEIVHLKGQGGVHSKPYAKARGMHRGMWVFYRKHLSDRYAAPVTVLVWLGIAASFALSSGAVTWRRARRALSGAGHAPPPARAHVSGAPARLGPALMVIGGLLALALVPRLVAETIINAAQWQRGRRARRKRLYMSWRWPSTPATTTCACRRARGSRPRARTRLPRRRSSRWPRDPARTRPQSSPCWEASSPRGRMRRPWRCTSAPAGPRFPPGWLPVSCLRRQCAPARPGRPRPGLSQKRSLGWTALCLTLGAQITRLSEPAFWAGAVGARHGQR